MSYTRVNWQNKPSTATPINATNLNTMDAGIAALDTAVGTLDTAVQGKVDKVEGKGLSTNDFTDEDALKLAGIEDGAEVNVQADWDEADNTADDFIKNKPDLGVYAEKDSLWTDATASGNPVTIKTQSAQAAKQTILTMAPIQSGSGTPAPDNVRPISGRTQAEIVTQGINLWDEVTELGIIDQTTGQNQNANNQIRSKNYTAIQPNTKYCFLCKSARISQIFWYDKDNAYLSYTQNTTDSAFITTSPANAYYVRFQFSMAYGTTYQNDSGVNYPSSYTDYSAHTEQAVTISFGQTVYGGTLNVETGELTVNMGVIDLGDECLAWTRNATSGAFLTSNLSPAAATWWGTTKVSNVYCEQYEAAKWNDISSVNDAKCGVYDVSLRISDNRYATASSFKTGVAGVKLYYELATPVTTTLTAAQVNLLKGLNNVSTDADGISITYFADGESLTDADNRITAVLGDFATVEGARASQNYAIGDYLIFSDKFCKASTAIATGEVLAIGTNLTQTTIGAELKAILAQL